MVYRSSILLRSSRLTYICKERSQLHLWKRICKYIALKWKVEKLNARHEFVDIPVKASFSCADEKLNRIWQVCCETYRLCSGIWFWIILCIGSWVLRTIIKSAVMRNLSAWSGQRWWLWWSSWTAPAGWARIYYRTSGWLDLYWLVRDGQGRCALCRADASCNVLSHDGNCAEAGIGYK